jgi:hypothetical protein
MNHESTNKFCKFNKQNKNIGLKPAQASDKQIGSQFCLHLILFTITLSAQSTLKPRFEFAAIIWYFLFLFCINPLVSRERGFDNPEFNCRKQSKA